jgi:hypothetical protein
MDLALKSPPNPYEFGYRENPFASAPPALSFFANHGCLR